MFPLMFEDTSGRKTNQFAQACAWFPCCSCTKFRTRSLCAFLRSSLLLITNFAATTERRHIFAAHKPHSLQTWSCAQIWKPRPCRGLLGLREPVLARTIILRGLLDNVIHCQMFASRLKCQMHNGCVEMNQCTPGGKGEHADMRG